MRRPAGPGARTNRGTSPASSTCCKGLTQKVVWQSASCGPIASAASSRLAGRRPSAKRGRRPPMTSSSSIDLPAAFIAFRIGPISSPEGCPTGMEAVTVVDEAADDEGADAGASEPQSGLLPRSPQPPFRATGESGFHLVKGLRTAIASPSESAIHPLLHVAHISRRVWLKVVPGQECWTSSGPFSWESRT